MIKKVQINFNSNLLIQDITVYLYRVLEHASVELLNDFSAGASVSSSKLKKAGFNSLDGFWKYTIEQIKYTLISYVGNDSYNAFISNYGSGSLLDEKNPQLSFYKSNSSLGYNPNRPSDNAIIGREKGTYSIANYEDGNGTIQRTSKGNLAGVNLETTINTKTGKPFVTPVSPTHWLENGELLFAKKFNMIVQDALNKFPFNDPKYFKVN